jgi:hypothetical protein
MKENWWKMHILATSHSVSELIQSLHHSLQTEFLPDPTTVHTGWMQKPGEWNTIDLYSVGGTSVHMINGVVNMILPVIIKVLIISSCYIT